MVRGKTGQGLVIRPIKKLSAYLPFLEGCEDRYKYTVSSPVE